MVTPSFSYSNRKLAVAMEWWSTGAMKKAKKE
jgi:hypothetical protein